MLCAMLRVKVEAVLLTCRKTPELGVSIIEKPIINFKATEYYNLISDTWLEPILTINIKTYFLTNNNHGKCTHIYFSHTSFS